MYWKDKRISSLIEELKLTELKLKDIAEESNKNINIIKNLKKENENIINEKVSQKEENIKQFEQNMEEYKKMEKKYNESLNIIEELKINNNKIINQLKWFYKWRKKEQNIRRK